MSDESTPVTPILIPWPSVVSEDGEVGVNEGSPMCGLFNGGIICCREKDHKGKHATPYPGDDGPIWVRWMDGGPFGSCHAGDPETRLYCCLEVGHAGRHMAVANRGPGVVLARWERVVSQTGREMG